MAKKEELCSCGCTYWKHGRNPGDRFMLTGKCDKPGCKCVGFKIKPSRTRKYLKDPNLVEFYGEGYGTVWADPLGNAYPELRELYFDALRLFFPKVDHEDKLGDPHLPMIPYVGHGEPTGSFTTFHIMTPEQQKAANELYSAIGKAVYAAYKNGLDYGRSLLPQLITGEIRLSDFDQPHRSCRCGQSLPTGNSVCPNCKHDIRDDIREEA